MTRFNFYHHLMKMDEKGVAICICVIIPSLVFFVADATRPSNLLTLLYYASSLNNNYDIGGYKTVGGVSLCANRRRTVNA